jgi:hypothetical protein
MASPSPKAEFGDFFDCGFWQVFSISIDYLMNAASYCFCYG